MPLVPSGITLSVPTIVVPLGSTSTLPATEKGSHLASTTLDATKMLSILPQADILKSATLSANDEAANTLHGLAAVSLWPQNLFKFLLLSFVLT